MATNDPGKVRRILELRRSSAASPRDTSRTRSLEQRLAIQEYDEDGACIGACPYGTCGGGPDPCGGCCGCMGCEMANDPGWNDADPLVMDVPKDEGEEN